MSKVIVTKDKLDYLANAISVKSGDSLAMTIDEMIESVDGIDTSGIVPVGNVVITHSGQTDVTNYATATVPEGTVYVSGSYNFYTQSGVRKWYYGPYAKIDIGDGLGTPGFIEDGAEFEGYNFVVNAVPANTTITPTESSQTVGGQAYMMEGAVTVNAIPSNYVGSGITRRSSSDMTASGATVTAPAGYYASSASKTVASGTVVSSIEYADDDPDIWVDSSGVVHVSGGYSASVHPVSSSGWVNSSTTTEVDIGVSGTYQLPTGTEGTPTATKGTVSNHSVTVTPSVTNSAGYISGGTKTGTGVSVSASELVSGSQTITQNGTVDVTNLASVTVAVEGGGGSGMTVATANTTLASANASISFTGLSGEPTSFVVTTAGDLATGASPYKTATVVFDGTDLHGQIVTNTSNANASYSTSFTKSYSNGTLTVTGSGTNFHANQYKLIYTYGGNSANIGTAETQVGSGATSITFTGLTDEPDYFSVIFKSNFSTSSGYQRVMSVAYDGTNTYGVAMDSGAKAMSSWSYTYSNGSLTVSSQGTNNGGYFHQPGYYQLTYGIGGTVEPTEIEVEPLSVTQNGTYTAPTGKAYSPVTVNVSGGTINVATTTWTNSDSTATSHTFTGLLGTPKAAFLRCTSSLSRSSGSSNYFVADMRWTGSAAAGNSFRRSNGTYANVTSGYSFSASGTSLTVTTSGTSTSNPGSFYNGTYELVYIY